MSTSEFWEKVFRNLGFEKATILGRTAFKIPIYEAIYMSQVMGPPEPSDFNIWWRQPFRVAIPTKDGKVLRFPNPCPSVLIKEIFMEETTMDSQLNPMLSPSLNFIKKSVPEFFNSAEKYLVFGDDSNLLEQIKAEGLNPADFVPFKEGHESGINKGSVRRYMDEEVVEYITSSFFRSRGFIVDKFSESLTLGSGGPDLFALKIPQLQNDLMDLKVTAGGFYLNELELWGLLGEGAGGQRIEEAKSIVIEVESPTDSGRFSQGKRQLLRKPGYLNDGCYDEGYVALPFEEHRPFERKAEELGFIPEEDVGLLTLSEEGEFILRDCPKFYGKQEKIAELLRSVERIVKLALLKNLPLTQTFGLLPQVQSFYDLYFAVDNLDVEGIVTYIRQKWATKVRGF
jgi:hypothetical protein